MAKIEAVKYKINFVAAALLRDKHIAIRLLAQCLGEVLRRLIGIMHRLPMVFTHSFACSMGLFYQNVVKVEFPLLQNFF